MRKIEDLNVRDPYILRHDEYYYLFASSGDFGFPCFVSYRSKDLKTFEEPRIIFKQNDNFWGKKDFWAPEVHYYRGKFYLFASFKAEGRCRGTSVLVCDYPDGEYHPLKNDPLTPLEWECLDGSLFVEDGIPYMFFCKEWLQINDGEIYLVKLTSDLKDMADRPRLLFKGSDAEWTRPIMGDNNYVTDGPFVFKKNGKYYMIWSSYSENGYALGLATSESLTEKWHNTIAPLYDNNGGHGMIFESDGMQMIALHAPNSPDGHERIQLIPLEQLID